MNIIVAPLELVYPPVTNQEAIWLEEDKETEEVLRTSHFYMIGIRAEAKFDFTATRPDSDGSVTRIIGSLAAGPLRDEFELDVGLVLETVTSGVSPDEQVSVSLGPKIIQIFLGDTLVEWFTTEKLIYQRSLDWPGILGLQKVREFATYELFYVGIATKTDTFTRLFAGAHKARQRILGNEQPRLNGARVTDEVVLFAFRINHFGAGTLSEDSAVPPINEDDVRVLNSAIIADAEKAFVHLLNPQYNTVKYDAYPGGADGLYHHGLGSYGFFVNENITFSTPTESFRGATHGMIAHGKIGRNFDSHADVISVRGDTVGIIKGAR
jgi:hypothetical protein